MKKLLATGCLAAACWQWMILPVYAEEVFRPIPAWPLIYHREDRDHAETDVLWPFFRYEREKTGPRYAIRLAQEAGTQSPKIDDVMVSGAR